MKTRIEKDLLGEKEIPFDAFWGIHTLRAVENFPISGRQVGENLLFVQALGYVKKASALANKEMQTIPADVADSIAIACDELINNTKNWSAQFPSDIFQGGAGTSINMNANEVIANIALEKRGLKKGDYQVINPNDHVNKCQSTNDSYPTAFRVSLYKQIEVLEQKLEGLRRAFLQKGQEFAQVLKMGRTQLQDAVPMSLGQEFNAFATLIKEDIKLMKHVQGFLLEVNLGATAIGTGLNAPEGYAQVAVKHLAQVTGLPFVCSEDYIEATSDCGAYVIVSSALKRTAIKISKICNDLRLLSSGPRAGLNEINLPQMQAGSSIMPAKVNPVIPEVVNQVCFKVMGNDLTISLAAEAGQLQLNVMEPVIASSLFESLKLLCQASVVLTEKCVKGISANAEITKNHVMNSIGIVTYLDPIIGHDEGDKIGKICAQTGRSVAEVALERGVVTQEQLDELFSFENLIHPKYIRNKK